MARNNSSSGNNSLSAGQSTIQEMGGQLRPSRSRIQGAMRIVKVRLRFLAIFALAALIVGKWETLSTYWDWLTTSSSAEAPQTVSSDTEYFCPMDPGVVSDWPTKCPVCNMALVRRKKGSPVQLPNGVVSRMQYSPIRLQLAGVRTSAVGYQPLACEIKAQGFVETKDTQRPTVEVEVPDQDRAVLRIDQDADVSCLERPGSGPWPAHVRNIQFDADRKSTGNGVRLEIDDHDNELSPGMEVSVRIHVPIASLEPFCSQPTDPEPVTPNEQRRVFVCPKHPDVLSDVAGKCPRDELALVELPLSDSQRLRYWCPMHPHVTSSLPGKVCDECGGMPLVPRLITYRPPDQVLAVPENAVIDSGQRHIVYVDRGAGMFDGVDVVVGPRSGGYYSVVSGLQSEEHVASAGVFLLDAETRLASNASTAYFGATTNRNTSIGTERPSVSSISSADDDPAMRAKIDSALAQLSPEDERQARIQRICPVTHLVLGSMGKPEKLVVADRIVFLCCSGCTEKLRDNPDRYLPPSAPPAESSRQQ